LKTLISFGPKIRKSVEARPDGLLLQENLLPGRPWCRDADLTGQGARRR
jgi:hypothetical protein